MSNVEALPELRQILGALISGSNRPLSVRELHTCVVEVSEGDAAVGVYAEVEHKHIRDALVELSRDLERHHTGFSLEETAGGYRVRSDARCGRWLKHLLKAKPNHSGCRDPRWKRWRLLGTANLFQKLRLSLCVE